MSARYHGPAGSDSVAQTAADWVVRHDRGLTSAEQDELSEWLASDARHQAAWAEHRWGWDELDRVAGLQNSVHAAAEPDLLAPEGNRRQWFRIHRTRPLAFLAAAAVVMLGLVLWQRPWSKSTEVASHGKPHFPALIEQRELPDGSVVELNRGAAVTELFTAGERRVRLNRGEAHFKVAKDSLRPFVVEARGVAVHAVGTAFNVRIDAASIEVLVTEGKVNVASNPELPRATAATATPPAIPINTLVATGQRIVVSLAATTPVPDVNTLSPAQIGARLAWQPQMLDFTDAPLKKILADFNHRNPVRLTLGEPSLADLRLSGTFRSDNVEGFVGLMVSDFGMRIEWRGGTEIILHKAATAPRR
jgi:transmembrane sensor